MAHCTHTIKSGSAKAKRILALKRERRNYWKRVLQNAVNSIGRMSVPDLVRLVSDDIFVVKTGCGFLETNENQLDLHSNQVIRIVVEEKLADYLKSNEMIFRESARVGRKIDRLVKMKQANQSFFHHGTAEGDHCKANSLTNRRSCVIM